jgi:hypothetical protein
VNVTNPETDSAERLLGKADALMRRHRAFIAQPAIADVRETAPEIPAVACDTSETPDAGDDDDLPVLTDIVASNELIASEMPLEIVSGEAVAAETQRWLDEELPGAVLSVLDGLADHLVATITVRMRTEVLDALRKPSID